MKNQMLILVIAMLGITGHADTSTKQEKCRSDKNLKKAGFQVHNTGDFHSLSAKVLQNLDEDKKDFVFDLTTKVYSNAAKTWARVTSHDRTSTPQMEMYGDVLIIENLNTKTLFEVRWYKEGVKHIVYNSKYQSCATNYIPLADNALF